MLLHASCKMKTVLLLLRNICKSVKYLQPRQHFFCYYKDSGRRKLKVTKFTENILNFDPFQIVFACLYINCTLGVAPYRFDKKKNRLCPQEGWKWLLWRLVYGVILPLRLALSVFTPFFTSMKFESIGNHVGVDELNLYIFCHTGVCNALSSHCLLLSQ